MKNSGYPEEFLAKLRRVNVPIEDLRDCIINRDVMEVNPEIACIWNSMIDSWSDSGMHDEDIVNLFFYVACSQLASLEADSLMDEIEEFLGGCECG